LKANNEAIPLTSFHELEFINAIHLKLFRNETTPQTIRQIKATFEEHEKRGIYYRPPLDWPAVFIHAIQLSKKHSASLGSRALDILHVASALSIQADRFLTLDDRQSKLAALAGLEIPSIFQTAK
jgi:predicted nucleic acid-binding protein